jgi:hypothetical protein
MIAPSGPGGRQDPLELGGAGSSAVARKTLTARRGPNSGQDSPKKHATPRALPCRALEVDAHPLAITSAFGELVYSVLIRRLNPTRGLRRTQRPFRPNGTGARHGQLALLVASARLTSFGEAWFQRRKGTVRLSAR